MSEQESAVEHLTRLLERDELTVDEYRVLVDRVLATTTAVELADALGDLAPMPAAITPVLLLECQSGVVKERPTHLPEAVEIRCESGVMKLDLSRAVLEAPVTDLDIEVLTGVVKITLPRDAVIETGDRVNGGGVTKMRIRGVEEDSWRPRIVVHVRNERGVLKISRSRR